MLNALNFKKRSLQRGKTATAGVLGGYASKRVKPLASDGNPRSFGLASHLFILVL